jgi:hypothetical protein
MTEPSSSTPSPSKPPRGAKKAKGRTAYYLFSSEHRDGVKSDLTKDGVPPPPTTVSKVSPSPTLNLLTHTDRWISQEGSPSELPGGRGTLRAHDSGELRTTSDVAAGWPQVQTLTRAPLPCRCWARGGKRLTRR